MLHRLYLRGMLLLIRLSRVRPRVPHPIWIRSLRTDLRSSDSPLLHSAGLLTICREVLHHLYTGRPSCHACSSKMLSLCPSLHSHTLHIHRSANTHQPLLLRMLADINSPHVHILQTVQVCHRHRIEGNSDAKIG